MIRAAVIGVGSFGRHHARVYADLDDVELVAVADTDLEKAEQVARTYKIPYYGDHLTLLVQERPDIVSVVVPTAKHHTVAMAALVHGVHTLVEKPIASSRSEAEELLAAAERGNVVLTVGHIERFNPAVIELRQRLAAGELGALFQIHSRRTSPLPAYVDDVGVVMDLATHEVDLLRYILGSEPEAIYAETMRWIHPGHEDMLIATLRFPQGPIALLDVNWLTPEKTRELRITGERGMFVVDYVRQDLTFYEATYRPQGWDTLALFRGMEEGNVTRIRLRKKEPLRTELERFVYAVAHEQEPDVTGEDGLRALVLAETLLATNGRPRAIEV